MGGKLGMGGDDDMIVDINITPFVDIILVVLIIFMVTASTIVKSSIKLTLPDAASAEATDNDSFGVTLLPDGSIHLDEELVTVDVLVSRLKEAKAKNKDVVVLISADKTIAHGRVVWLFDLVKDLGIAKFAININKADAIGPDPATMGLGLGTP